MPPDLTIELCTRGQVTAARSLRLSFLSWERDDSRQPKSRKPGGWVRGRHGWLNRLPLVCLLGPLPAAPSIKLDSTMILCLQQTFYQGKLCRRLVPVHWSSISNGRRYSLAMQSISLAFLCVSKIGLCKYSPAVRQLHRPQKTPNLLCCIRSLHAVKDRYSHMFISNPDLVRKSPSCSRACQWHRCKIHSDRDSLPPESSGRDTRSDLSYRVCSQVPGLRRPLVC